MGTPFGGGSDERRDSNAVLSSAARVLQSLTIIKPTLWPKSRMRCWSLSGTLWKDTLALVTGKISSKIQKLRMRSHESVLGTALRSEAKIVSYQEILLVGWSGIHMRFPSQC